MSEKQVKRMFASLWFLFSISQFFLGFYAHIAVQTNHPFIFLGLFLLTILFIIIALLAFMVYQKLEDE